MNMKRAMRRCGLGIAVWGGLMAGGYPPQAEAAGPMPNIKTTNTYMQYYGGDFGATNLAALSTYDVVVLDPNVQSCTPAVVATLKSNGVDYVLAYITVGEEHRDATWVVGDGLGPVRYSGGSVIPTTGGVFNVATNVVVDGNMTNDWLHSNFTYFGPDPDDTNDRIDWQDAWFAHDASTFYVAYRLFSPVTNFNWGYIVYLDTDRNRGTGFRGGSDNLSVGANYMIQGASIFQYTGSGLDWSWNFVGTATYAVSGNMVELSFAKTLVGTPANNALDMIFVGDNSAQGGATVDAYPDDCLAAGGTGVKISYPLLIASFYIDQAWNGSGYTSDGHPDMNGEFFSRFVNPNADWRWVINEQRIGGVAGVAALANRYQAGLKQIAGARVSDSDTDRTHNFGFDGFFLDTLDTASPYSVERAYPWTAMEMQATVKYIHDAYTNKIVFGNRGVFFYNPTLVNATFGIRPYDYTIRPYIHASLFESYILDSSFSTNISPYLADNKNNYAPKMIAEANRPDGFTIFCLDYMQNRGTNLYARAIRETVVTNGWVEYLSPDGAIDKVGNYVKTHAPPADTVAPVWDSTGANTSNEVPDRIGIQSVALGSNPGEVIVHWDVARDQTPPVRYTIYRATNAAFTGTVTAYSNVAFTVGDGWGTDPTTAYANKYVLTGVPLGTNYFRVRARDSSTAAGREETNTVALSLTLKLNEVSNPQSTGVVVNGSLTDWSGLRAFGPDAADVTGTNNPLDWVNVWMAHDLNKFYIAITNDGPLTINAAVNFYLDTDANRNTGFRGGANNFPVGAEYLLQGVNLFQYTGTGLDFSWSYVGGVSWTTSGNVSECALSRSRLQDSGKINLFCYGDNPGVGGTTVDLLPDNALAVGGGGGMLTYRVREFSNPFTNITVNGNVTDWAPYRSFGSDPADIAATNAVDYLEAWMGHDTNRFYVALKVEGTQTYNTRFNVYMDTDGKRTTGFRNTNDTFAIGADYRVNGTNVQRYTGTGLNSSWVTTGTITRTTVSNITEFSFLRSLVTDPAVMTLFIAGENGTSGNDYFPDYVLAAGGGGEFFTYRKNDLNNTVATNAIVVDSNLADWTALKPFDADLQDATAAGDTLDWNLAWMAHSTSNLYLAFQNHGVVSSINGAWNIYLDTDGNRLTGYRNADVFPLGANYLLQGTTLFQYTGDGLSWSWSVVGTVGYSWGGNNAEIQIPRTWLGSPRVIKLLFLGDNSAAGGTTVDMSPDTAIKAGGSGSFHTYRLP